MAIFIDKSSKVIIQGITGKIGSVFAERMSIYYDNFVGGVTPGKGGHKIFEKPVYNTVKQAVKELGANTSIISVNSRFAQDAVYEAIDAGIKTVWIYSDGIPVHTALEMIQYAKLNNVTIIGPNSSGIVSPGKASAAELSELQLPLKEGNIGIISKSGSLCYEVVYELHNAGYGFSTIICVGGDPIIGTTMKDAVEEFKKDEETKAIIMLGEIGGNAETECIETIKSINKPVLAYICGHSAPKEKKMGHAGAIISGKTDTAAAKTKILGEAGVITAMSMEEIPYMLKAVIKS